MNKTAWLYLEVLVSFLLAGLGAYFGLSGLITGEIYFPVLYSRTSPVSLAANPGGFYTALALWSVIAIALFYFGVEHARKVKK